ncbi:S1 family peptidase [Microbacterium betulae]|uniref:S1 family peptidase n=1 Tax=Microbacterium betulae TaxID=2981139 RepID=A0AA97I6F8_9MICO|nr:S1 family peptidase [Microbacterium sp. AB]WOF22410.1 S1 family peptidase [Microbacterium sp. AB]
MKSSTKRGVRLGALGVASALAFGGVVATSASAEEGAVAPTEGAAFDQLALQFFQDESVTGVLKNGDGGVIVQQLADADSTSALVEATASAAALADGYTNVHIVTVSEDELAKPTATTDVVGGAGIALLDAAGAGGFCSVGFPAWTPDGEPAILTAGHCTGDGQYGSVYLTDPQGDPAGGGADDNSTVELTYELGTVGFNQFGGAGNTAGTPEDAIDIAAVDVTNDELTLVPALSDWTNLDDLSASLASDITAVGTAEIGETIQRSGRTTGYSSGVVDTDQVNPYVEYEGYIEVDGRLVKGFAAATQVIPGDSGGTILQGSTAVGVVSATFQLDGVEHLWGADLQTGLAATNGYTVALALEDPAITSLESGANIAWNAEISGTGPAGATLEYAFLPQGADASFEDAAETAIADDGTWTLTGPATPGDYTVYVRAASGFDTSATASVDVQVFPTAPAITTPTNGQAFDEPVTSIAGEAAANAEVTLSGDVNAKVTADADGNWSYDADIHEAGSYTVSAQQTINGKTSDETTVEFSVGQAVTPDPTIINPVDGGSYVEGSVPAKFVGEGLNGATVELRVDDQLVGSATVEANVWEIAVDQLGVGEHTVAARQIVDGVASNDVVVSITVTAVAEEPQQPEEPNEAPEQTPAPQEPQQPGDPQDPQGEDPLAPTGAEFNGTAPLAIGFGLVVVAGGVLLLARVRQLKSQR